MGYLIETVVGAAGSLVAAELCANSGRAARWLINRAADRLPQTESERFQEEWLADLNDMPGAIQKLSWAIGCHWAATVANVRAWRTSKKAVVKATPPVIMDENTRFAIAFLFIASIASKGLIAPIAEGSSGGMRAQSKQRYGEALWSALHRACFPTTWIGRLLLFITGALMGGYVVLRFHL